MLKIYSNNTIIDIEKDYMLKKDNNLLTVQIDNKNYEIPISKDIPLQLVENIIINYKTPLVLSEKEDKKDTYKSQRKEQKIRVKNPTVFFQNTFLINLAHFVKYIMYYYFNLCSFYKLVYFINLFVIPEKYFEVINLIQKKEFDKLKKEYFYFKNENIIKILFNVFDALKAFKNNKIEDIKDNELKKLMLEIKKNNKFKKEYIDIYIKNLLAYLQNNEEIFKENNILITKNNKKFKNVLINEYLHKHKIRYTYKEDKNINESEIIRLLKDYVYVLQRKNRKFAKDGIYIRDVENKKNLLTIIDPFNSFTFSIKGRILYILTPDQIFGVYLKNPYNIRKIKYYIEPIDINELLKDYGIKVINSTNIVFNKNFNIVTFIVNDKYICNLYLKFPNFILKKLINKVELKSFNDVLGDNYKIMFANEKAIVIYQDKKLKIYYPKTLFDLKNEDPYKIIELNNSNLNLYIADNKAYFYDVETNKLIEFDI